MSYTIEQVKAIAALQLTADEIYTLKLLANVEAVELAFFLEVTRQHISQISKRAEAKIRAQGLERLGDDV